MNHIKKTINLLGMAGKKGISKKEVATKLGISKNQVSVITNKLRKGNKKRQPISVNSVMVNDVYRNRVYKLKKYMTANESKFIIENTGKSYSTAGNYTLKPQIQNFVKKTPLLRKHEAKRIILDTQSAIIDSITL